MEASDVRLDSYDFENARIEPVLGRSVPAWTTNQKEIREMLSDRAHRYMREGAVLPAREPHRTKILEKLQRKMFMIRLRSDLPSKVANKLPDPLMLPVGARHDRRTHTTQPEQIIPLAHNGVLTVQFDTAVELLHDMVWGAFLEEVPDHKQEAQPDPWLNEAEVEVKETKLGTSTRRKK